MGTDVAKGIYNILKFSSSIEKTGSFFCETSVKHVFYDYLIFVHINVKILYVLCNFVHVGFLFLDLSIILIWNILYQL